MAHQVLILMSIGFVIIPQHLILTGYLNLKYLFVLQ